MAIEALKTLQTIGCRKNTLVRTDGVLTGEQKLIMAIFGNPKNTRWTSVSGEGLRVLQAREDQLFETPEDAASRAAYPPDASLSDEGLYLNRS